MSTNGGNVVSGVGSILLMDSTIQDTPTGVLLRGNPAPNRGDTSGTLLLDNVRVSNVPAVVADINGPPLLTSSGQETIRSWGRGSRYEDMSGVNTFSASALPNKNKPAVLLDGQGNFFAKSRPQYEDLTVNDFASVKGAFYLLNKTFLISGNIHNTFLFVTFF